jgi:phosphoglycerate dehydrogenase-like enzyme
MSKSGELHKILVTLAWDRDHIEKLFKALEPAQIVYITPHGDTLEIMAAIKDADAAILGGDISRELLAAAKKIKWIHCDHAGLNKSAHPELFQRGIILTSSAGRSGPVLAEHAFFFMFSFLYDSYAHAQNQREHKFEKILTNRFGLITKTAGIIGLGNTGREFVKRAKAFGMRVLAYNRSTVDLPGVDKGYFKDRGDTIDELLKESDFIVLAVRLSDDTFHLIDERAFSLMKETAVLINMARGSVVDEKALYNALKNKRILGAGCDTFEIEPLSKESPLWDLPNIIITAHNTPAIADKTGYSLGIITDNIRLFREGAPLRNRYDQRDIYTHSVSIDQVISRTNCYPG